MPAGISEGLIRRAFAPIDLSYAYQRLDATQRILNAEDRALKQQAQKDFYTELASIKKDLGGVRSEDIAEISKKYKQWADVSRQLAANPRLITNNPEKYGELKSQADTLYGQALRDIEESKEMKKLLQATTEKLGDVRNFDLLDEGAYEKFKQNALFRPTKELIQTGTYSFNNYISPIIDSKDFIKKTANDIDSQAIIKNYEIPDTIYKDEFGRTKKDKVNNVPLDSTMYSIVSKNLTDMKRGNVFAKQRLDEMIATNEDVAIRNAYDKFYTSDKAKEFKEFYDPSKKLVYDESASVKDRYAKLYAMSEFLNRVGVATREQGMPKLGDVEAIQLRQRLRDLSEKGKAVEGAQGYVDAWNSIKEKLSKAPDATSLDKFDIMYQGLILDMVKGAGLDANNRDIYLKENRNTKGIEIYTMKDFSYIPEGKQEKDRVFVYRKNEKIGDLTPTGINLLASVGVKGKTTAVAGAGRTLTPPKKMN